MKDNYTQEEIKKEMSKLNKNMHKYDILWKENKEYSSGINYSDRLETARREIESLLHYNIISIDPDNGKIVLTSPEFYLFGYYDIFGFSGEDDVLYYIMDKIYIKDVDGEYDYTYLQSPEYYIS
jgi:hypothetical protein